MSEAELILKEKRLLPDGDILEMVIYRLPAPVPPSRHHFKYRMVLIRNGERLVGYDNERGKGDHRHHHGAEEHYPFRGLRELIADFRRDVKLETENG